jgi:hypothetical protein
LLVGLAVVSFVVASPRAHALSAADPDGTPQLLTELLFNAATPMTSSSIATGATPGWVIGAQNGGSIGVQETTGPAGTTVDALEGSYPVPAPNGAEYMWAQYNVASLNTKDIYIEFWAQMPGLKEGCKFVKIFGQNLTQGSYADTTIATDYTGVDYGAIRQISFGDGTALANDSQNVINLNGSNPQWIGRSYGTAVVQTPQMSAFSSSDWGTGWHHFRIHVKFNDGTTAQNEVPNGEYYLEVDGKIYVDATGIYNRNPANGPIDYIGFFGWAQSDTGSFQLWYDDIRISTGGFMTQPLPNPPANVSAS